MAAERPSELVEALRAEMARPVHPDVSAVAKDIHDRHPEGTLAVVFYGSCLRDDPEGKNPVEGVLDFYLIAESYEALYTRRLTRWLNRLLPPNVFYIESGGGSRGTEPLRAKYAVVSTGHLRRLCRRKTLNPYFWARFAQPTRVILARDDAVRSDLAETAAEAVTTAVAAAAPLMNETFRTETLWTRLFRETFRTELRSEGEGRAKALVAPRQDFYDSVTGPALGAVARKTAEGYAMTPGTHLKAARSRLVWPVRRFQGKLLSVFRLIKGAFTFDGGLDYVLWKVARHSGQRIEPTAWQRRHPLLAAPGLAWRLYRRGAFR